MFARGRWESGGGPFRRRVISTSFGRRSSNVAARVTDRIEGWSLYVGINSFARPLKSSSVEGMSYVICSPAMASERLSRLGEWAPE